MDTHAGKTYHRWIYYIPLILLIPISFAYPIEKYTGGNIFIAGGEEITLELPAETGDNCLPMVILRVEGGEDYPTIKVGSIIVRGGGIHRIPLERNIAVIEINSSKDTIIRGNSEVVCSKDPFVEAYMILEPIKYFNYNYITYVLRNEGYTEANVKLYLNFHTNIAPFHPPYEYVRVPPRSKVTYTLFVVSAPFFEGKSHFPQFCIEYNDSISSVFKCYGPFELTFLYKPLIKCINEECVRVFPYLDEKNLLSQNVERLVITPKDVEPVLLIDQTWVGIGLTVLGLVGVVLLYAGFI